MEWDMVIGLEVHAQLNTKTKLFSGTETTFGAPPNSQTSFIDAGLPGVLPVLNQQAVVMAIQLGLAINATINNDSVFERKNYFYPDLPKGYQISQFQKPIVSNGQLSYTLDDGTLKTVQINRAHLEEDAGKSLHHHNLPYTGIDLNRAGTPLLEIVTEPCLYSIEEAVKYLKTLHQLVRFLGICDGNMEQGSFRCDVNLSLKPHGSKTLGTRTELKNLNSFRFIEKAIAYERARHQDILEHGGTLQQETRLYNPDTNTTQVMRSKENENDYRYFPDPDLLPITITEAEIATIKEHLPALPAQLIKIFQTDATLNDEDIHFILASPAAYYFYKEVRNLCLCPNKLLFNWLKGPYAAALNETQTSFDTPPVSAKNLAILLDKIHEKSLSANNAKQIFIKLCEGEEDIQLIIQREGYHQTQDHSAIENTVKHIIHLYPNQVAEYKTGKEKLMAFFVGQVMKEMKGKADPDTVNQLLKQYLAL